MNCFDIKLNKFMKQNTEILQLLQTSQQNVTNLLN